MLQIKKIFADHVVDFAAEELKKYLRMMMPEKGEIAISYAPDAKDGFRLGLLADFDLPFTGKDPQEDDEYYIQTTENGGILAGSNPRSVLFAVYRYLKLCGCRFLFPGAEGEIIPLQDIVPQNYHKLADHRFRAHALEGDPSLDHVLNYIDYMGKQEMNGFGSYGIINYMRRYYLHRYNEENRAPENLNHAIVERQWRALYEAEVKKRGMNLFCGGHRLLGSAMGLNPADRWNYREQKLQPPAESVELMAMIGGKRGLHRNDPDFTNICMSNPKARAKVVEQVIKELKAHPQNDRTGMSIADTTHNHCECPECQKKRPSDWLVVMLNEIDEALTAEGIQNKLAFSSYVDTIFAPLEEKIKNPDRFTLVFCPISRNYLTSITEDTVLPEPIPYVRNAWEAPQTMEDYVALFKKWEYAFNGSKMTYEYHYWKPQFRDLGMQFFSRRIYEDVLGLKLVGTDGSMEDGSNRSFWPNGFHDYIYCETLMNRDLDYEAEQADYYSHCYGEDWKIVKTYLENITEAFDYPYMVGANSADREKGDYYNPAIAEKLAKVAKLAEDMRAIAAQHNDMPNRPQQIFWRNIALHADYCEGIAKVLTHKCCGRNEEAEKEFRSFMREFGKQDYALDKWFDFGLAADSIYKVVVAKTRNKMEVL